MCPMSIGSMFFQKPPCSGFTRNVVHPGLGADVFFFFKENNESSAATSVCADHWIDTLKCMCQRLSIK